MQCLIDTLLIKIRKIAHDQKTQLWLTRFLREVGGWDGAKFPRPLTTALDLHLGVKNTCRSLQNTVNIPVKV